MLEPLKAESFRQLLSDNMVVGWKGAVERGKETYSSLLQLKVRNDRRRLNLLTLKTHIFVLLNKINI